MSFVMEKLAGKNGKDEEKDPMEKAKELAEDEAEGKIAAKLLSSEAKSGNRSARALLTK